MDAETPPHDFTKLGHLYIGDMISNVIYIVCYNSIIQIHRINNNVISIYLGIKYGYVQIEKYSGDTEAMYHCIRFNTKHP